jgi:hypothetical protein
MANVINTYGVASKFTTSALMGLGATQQDANGRFYVDGSMVNVELSRVIAETIYIKEIFRDGQSVNAKYVTGEKRGGAVRVMLDTPLPFSSRTLSFGGRAGTDGNGGVINVNAPELPANDEFLVYLNQVNDQMMAFPDLTSQYIPLDIMAKKIGQYSDRVAMDRSSSILAEIIAYAFFRSMNGATNLIDSGDLSQDNAYATLINSLNAKLSNGDPVRGAFTFPTEGRTIIGRPDFINGIFNRKSGVIMLGGDLAQEMLKNYDLDVRMSDRDYVGTGYKGYAMGFHYQEAPDIIWSLAEKYLKLPAGALANVKAIAVSFDATAVGENIDLGVKLVDATGFRGQLAQPLNIWGHEAFRLSYVIGDSSLTNDYLSTTLGMNEDTRISPIAPKKANGDDVVAVPIYDSNKQIVGYQQIASVPVPNGNNIKTGLPRVAQVNASANGAVSEGTIITLSTTTDGATIYYTTDGTEPTTTSGTQGTSVTINAATTVKAFAVKAGSIPSPVSTFTYTLLAD